MKSTLTTIWPFYAALLLAGMIWSGMGQQAFAGEQARDEQARSVRDSSQTFQASHLPQQTIHAEDADSSAVMTLLANSSPWLLGLMAVFTLLGGRQLFRRG